MNKLILLLLILTFSFSSNINAQKLKSVTTNTHYNVGALKPLPADFTTYSTSIKTRHDALSSVNYSHKSLIDKYLTLRSFQKLPNGGHFHINATPGRFTILSSKVVSKEHSKKGEDGKVTKSYTYSKPIAYKLTMEVTVEDKDGNVLLNKFYGTPSEGHSVLFKHNMTNSWSSSAAVSKAWTANNGAALAKIKKEAINAMFESASKEVKKLFDVRDIKAAAYLYQPKGKKLANAEEFEKFSLEMKKILAAQKSSENVNSTKEALAPSIKFFEEQKDNFSASDKKQVKVHIGCLVNLGTAYLAIDELTIAEDYANEALKAGAKKLTVKSLQDQIASAKEEMQRTGLTTRHYPVAITDAVGPEGVNYEHLSDFPKPVDNSVRMQGYFINSRGDSLTGEYVFRNGNANNLMLHKNGVRFEWTKNGEPQSWVINQDNFKKGGFSGRTFYKRSMIAGLTIKKVPFVFEILERGPKMNLYRAYPFSQKTEEAIGVELILEVKKEDTKNKLINLGLNNPRFIPWKTGFAELFESCEVLHAEITIGEYKREDDRIKEAVQIYNADKCE